MSRKIFGTSEVAHRFGMVTARIAPFAAAVLATGPHLHYEYLLNGVHMDPQTVHLPGAEPLQGDSLAMFHTAVVPLLASLSETTNPTPSVGPGPPAIVTAAIAAPTNSGLPGTPQNSSDLQLKPSVN